MTQARTNWFTRLFGNRRPKAPDSLPREEAGRLALYAEVSVDLEHGATDDQLAQTVSCGLGTAVQLFHAIGAQLPPGTLDG